MNNSTLSYKICQQLHEEIILSPRAFFSKHLLRSDIHVLEYLYSVCNKYKNNTYVSQERMAKDLGYSRKTVNESISRLRSFGIISTVNRYKKTCLYYLHEFFNSNSMRKNLSSFMRYYVSLSLALLVPQPGVTELNLDVYLESYSSSRNRDSINYAHDARVSGEQHGYLVFDTESKKIESVSKQPHHRRDALEASARLTKLREKFPITSHGMIKLSIFPDAAIDHAESMLSSVFKAGEPYSYFLKLCKNYCEQNGIAIEWGQYYRLKVNLGIGNEEPTLDKELLDGMKELHKQEPAKKTYNKKESHKVENHCPKEIRAGLDAAAKSHTEKMNLLRSKAITGETDYECVLNCEQQVHNNIMNDPNHYRAFGVSYAWKWKNLSIEEQREIIQSVHVDCTCRDWIKKEIGLEFMSEAQRPLAPAREGYAEKVISRPLPEIDYSAYEEVY